MAAERALILRVREDPAVERLRVALLPKHHATAKTVLRRNCRLVVSIFLRGVSINLMTSTFGTSADLIEDAIRWHMNKRDRLKRRACGKGRSR
jgi:hypothetical protein